MFTLEIRVIADINCLENQSESELSHRAAGRHAKAEADYLALI